ncbi:sodium dependent phosphate transporter [Trichuris trichiura]|uniref:Sodium dependent phosphate transporter n=1 Tax=Trichuris trichiura TaxID=36087 RepID=A0A077YX70_TRITR|nr:sodium dependent phosphate transporter [Trichuris trichiura]
MFRRCNFDLSTARKLLRIVESLCLIVLVFVCLYFFICSLDLMTDGFKLLGGHAIADAFRSNTILKSPIAILMIGIVVTAILQSSSTVTSIAVVMVGAGAFTVEQAYYVVMGSNVGTAVTSTIVALFSSGDRSKFHRAFAAAVIHDLYNWLGVVVMFPLEVITSALFDSEFFQKMIDPFTHLIFQVKHLMEGTRRIGVSPFVLNLNWPDSSIGGLLLFISLVMLLGGEMRRILHKSLNFQLRGRWNWLTGYVCILLGALITLVVQSSSIICSTMIPLVAMNVLSLERFWVYEIGADVGTTGTAIFAALATDTLKTPLQLSFCHFCFNFLSIFLFYSIPMIRHFPLRAAEFLGKTSAKYRWFALVYIAVTFIIFPFFIFALAYAGWIYPIIFLCICIILFALFKVIHFLQKRKPELLPKCLQSWDFLPLPLRSLEYYDRTCCCCFGGRSQRVADKSNDVIVKMQHL